MPLLDQITITHRYATLTAGFYQFVAPTPLDNLRWVSWNQQLAEQLDSVMTHPSLRVYLMRSLALYLMTRLSR